VVVCFWVACTPTGIDPTQSNVSIGEAMPAKQGFLPLFGFAYQGLVKDTEDAQGFIVHS